MYFNNCNTLDEAKTLFRKLSKELHPDHGGTDAAFIKMYKEFKAFRPKETRKGDENFDADKFYGIVKQFDELRDIKVVFVGSFIWLEDHIEGATKEQKELIKEIRVQGMNPARWARKKKLWYFSPENYKQKARSKKSYAQIKATYGAKEYETKKGLYLNQ